MSASQLRSVATQLSDKSRWKVRETNPGVFAVGNADTSKTMAVYAPGSEGKLACLFTTGHFNDNFTVDEKGLAVEVWVFGIGKLMVGREQAESKWAVESEENYRAIASSVLAFMEGIKSVAEKERAKGRSYVDSDPLYLLSIAKDYEKDMEGLSYRDLKSYWFATTLGMLELLMKTSPRMAKEAVGRKVPVDLLSPFFEHSVDLVALLHAYKHMYGVAETCVFVSEAFSEEVSRDDANWALKFASGLSSFDVQSGEDQSKLLCYVNARGAAEKMLGRANAKARDLTKAIFKDPSFRIAPEASLAYFDKCGYLDFFKENVGYSLAALAPRMSGEEVALVNAFAEGMFGIHDIFRAMV